MKTPIYSILAVFALAFLTISCEKEKNKQLALTGQLVNHSACKNGLKSTNERANTPDTLTCIDYSFDASNKLLSIKHINAGFNCCPDSMYCNVKISNDTIIVQEYEKSSLCNCNCLFDLDIEINGVDSKTYQIKFIEPYSGDQEKIVFEADLGKDKSGSFCATRKQYPWGTNNLIE